jgi:hypothetical protein
MRKLFYHKKRHSILGGMVVYLSLIFLFGTIVFGGLDAELNRGIQYNCELAEFSPDFTPQMKQECRRMRNKGVVYRYDT